MNPFVSELLKDPNEQAIVFGLLAVLLLSTTAGFLGNWLRRRPALRHAVLLSGLMACFSIPVISLFVARANGPLLSVPYLPFDRDDSVHSSNSHNREMPRIVESDREALSDQPLSPPDSNLAPTNSAHVAPQMTVAAARSRTTSWKSMLAGAWLIGTLILAAFSVRAWRQVSQIRRSAWPLAGREQALRATQCRLEKAGCATLPEIRLSDRVRAPVAVGILRSTIVLPACDIDQIEDEELADILIHETAHIERGDHLVLLLQALARCLFWPIPSIHWLNQQLAQAREEICDNYVLVTRIPVSYGQTLLKIAQLACDQQPLAAAVGILRRGALETRIAGLIDLGRDRAVKASRLQALLIVVFFVAGGLLLCGTRLVAQTDKQKSPVTPVDPSPTTSPDAPGNLAQPENKRDEAGADTIVGTVKWNGKPVSGFTIRAFRGSELLDQQFQADKNGQFRVPKAWRETDRFLAVVAYNNNCIGWFDFFVHERADQGGQTPDDGAFTITILDRGRRVRGRLANEQDQPIAGVRVRINTLSHPANLLSAHWADRKVNGERILPEAITDNDGWFELLVPVETTATARVDHSDWVNQVLPISKDAANLGTQKLTAAAKVAGQVIDARTGKTGTPLVGTSVSAQAVNAKPGGEWGSAITDQDGRYLIGGLSAGTFNVLFDDNSDKTLVAPAHAEVALTAGATFVANFSVNEGRHLTGQVVDVTTRQPLANCTVNCYGPARPQSGGATLSVQTNERGIFEFYVPPGKTYIYIGDERETDSGSERNLEVLPDRDPEPVLLTAGKKSKESRIRILVSNPVDRKITINAEQLKLAQFLATVANHAGLELDLDEAGLTSVGVPANTTVTTLAKEEALGPLLRRLFGPAKLDFVVVGRTLHFSNAEKIQTIRDSAAKQKSK